MSELKDVHCDVLIIGAGMAGMAASMFAAGHDWKTVQVGLTGGIHFASGMLDVLGVHPQGQGVRWKDPWAAIRKLVKDEPRHPYAKMSEKQIKTAVDRCIAFLNSAGLDYTCRDGKNSEVITPVGTVKSTYAMPRSMFRGAQAFASREPSLLIDFHGLKGFSARQIIETIGGRWPGLAHARLKFPDARGELYTEHAARKLDLPVHRKRLADRIRPHVGRMKAVGLPSILGVYHTRDVIADLREQLGAAVFEIPTMVPTVTGLRLREAFEQKLAAMGIVTLYQQRVHDAIVLPDGYFYFSVGEASPQIRIRTRGVVLASGRFLGKGLHADRDRIHETIFDLPVHQPTDRVVWHRRDLWRAEGHPINRTGLEIDNAFRPVDRNGHAIHNTLHAAGSILAHQDWTRQKCGSGLCIATAYGAVRSLAQTLQPSPAAAG